LTKSGFGHEWAARAGNLVTRSLDEPEEENLVTFINLALYWYTEGEWRKCFIYKCEFPPSHEDRKLKEVILTLS